MTRQPHAAHVFTRLLSTTDSGMGLYGCAYAMCSATEARRQGEPSPFRVRRERALARRQERSTR